MAKFLFKKGHKHSEETKKKLSLQKIGNKNPTWKGGKHSDGRGYIRMTVSPGVYIFEHRYLIEQKLGRKLDKNEHVHHINGIKTDNRLENLIVMVKSKHHSMHQRKQFNCDIEECDKPHRSKGLCAYHYNKRLLEGGF